MSYHLRRAAVRVAVLALAAGGAGCADGPTGPPSGLAVTLTVAPTRGAPAPASSIAAAGDSVVAEAVLNFSGCFDYSARAGTEGGALVVTVVAAPPAVPRGCTAVLAFATFRAVVRPAPRGTYPVVLRERADDAQSAAVDREVARATVTVP